MGHSALGERSGRAVGGGIGEFGVDDGAEGGVRGMILKMRFAWTDIEPLEHTACCSYVESQL